MICNNCSNKNVDEARFCAKCGTPLNTDVSKNEIKSIPNQQKKNESIWMKILGWTATIVGIALGRFLGLAFFLLLIPAWLGNLFINWYMKREDQQKWLLNLIIWSNVIFWFFPILGYFTSIASITIGSKSEENLKRKAQVLGWIGLILSLINSISGILINSSH